jgi:hypothetical protein
VLCTDSAEGIDLFDRLPAVRGDNSSASNSDDGDSVPYANASLYLRRKNLQVPIR